MTRFIIDCDPGHDDAMAILYAARHLDVVAITTVFGNIDAASTTRNALSLCTLAGLDIPVARGLDVPLARPKSPIAGADIHGTSGIDGADLPAPDREVIDTHAVNLIIEEARAHKGATTIAAIGPLTNVALALKMEPRLVDWLAGITIMGGSTTIGNVTPLAEYNIFCDPEAAAVVFECGLPIMMAGLNITRQAGITKAHADRLLATGGPVGTAFGQLMHFYIDRSHKVFNLAAASMHDPCALIPFVRDDLIVHRDCHVHVELASPHLRGTTACDLRRVSAKEAANVAMNRPANARVAVEIEGTAAVDHVVDALCAYDAGT